MLVIPNTTTTATDTLPGDAVFPLDAGALTPFTAGFLFVANSSAQISIRKGPQAPGVWSPYALVSPTLVPLSTDRGGRKSPDFIWGVKAKDGVPGTHAQIFGALFQAGEAGFVPSAQFGGQISPAGGFTPVVSFPSILAYQEFTVPVAVGAGTEGAPITIVSAGPVTFAGTEIVSVEFFSPELDVSAGDLIIISIWDLSGAGTNMGRWGRNQTGAVAPTLPNYLQRRLAPTAGAHTFAARGWTLGAAGTVAAGTGAGAGTLVPGFIRVTQIG